jgi:hypothetical protein
VSRVRPRLLLEVGVVSGLAGAASGLAAAPVWWAVGPGWAIPLVGGAGLVGLLLVLSCWIRST